MGVTVQQVAAHGQFGGPRERKGVLDAVGLHHLSVRLPFRLVIIADKPVGVGVVPSSMPF